MASSSDSSDDEAQIADLTLLTAVLEADEPCISGTRSHNAFSVNLSSASSVIQEEYSNIQTALSLNKLTDEKLKKLEGILTERLRECRERLKDIDDTAGCSTERTDKTFRYINCGKPYFKDANNFPAPDNEDTILMAKSQMYDYTSITSVPGWTIKDKNEFTAILQDMSIEIKKKELNSKIAQLERECKKGKTPKTDYNKGKGKIDYNKVKKIAALKKEMFGLDNKPFQQLALPIHEEYDWDMVASKSSNRHRPQEYRSLWKLFLHPSINKNTWTKTEHINLLRIAHDNELHDWDKIADELGTGRTGYQCFVYFRTNMSNTCTGQKWSKEEEEYLKRLIEYYKEESYLPWGNITSHMENRTKIQVYNKYFRLIEQRKGRFLPEEDAVILTCIKKFGQNFKKVTKYLPGRSMSQIRARYNVLYHGGGTKTSIVWTAEEDKKLIQFMANQDSLINYSSLTKHFPGKDRAHIRARYTTLVKWMKKHPNMDISKAPRRGARRLGHGVATQDLNKAVENLKIRIQSEVERKKSTRITRDSPGEVIDTAIVAALINEMNKEEEERKSKLCETEQSVLKEHWGVPSTPPNMTNLKKTLILLKAKLDKTKFQNSPVSQQFPELLKENQEKSVIVKSYSRTSNVEVLKVEEPDIWGSKTLDTTEYVFPPNYATITACRKLMAYATATSATEQVEGGERQIPFGVCTKKNVLLKEQLDLMMHRFNILFVWPMILSNEMPCENQVQHVNKLQPEKAPLLFGDPGIAIPCSGADIVNDNIDLTNSGGDERDITVKDIYVGNDDYLFMKH